MKGMFIKVKYIGPVLMSYKAIGKSDKYYPEKGEEFYLTEKYFQLYVEGHPDHFEIVDDATAIARRANIISRISAIVAVGSLGVAVLVAVFK